MKPEPNILTSLPDGSKMCINSKGMLYDEPPYYITSSGRVFSGAFHGGGNHVDLKFIQTHYNQTFREMTKIQPKTGGLLVRLRRNGKQHCEFVSTLVKRCFPEVSFVSSVDLRDPFFMPPLPEHIPKPTKTIPFLFELNDETLPIFLHSIIDTLLPLHAQFLKHYTLREDRQINVWCKVFEVQRREFRTLEETAMQELRLALFDLGYTCFSDLNYRPKVNNFAF